jgi:hypothetical protein
MSHRAPRDDPLRVVFTVDQAYRIKSNRSLLTERVHARPRDDGSGLLEIHCECSAQHCTATLVVLRSDYERLRPEHRQLLVALGHEMDSPVNVIGRAETYELVEAWRP